MNTIQQKPQWVDSNGFAFRFEPVEPPTIVPTLTGNGYEARYLVVDPDAERPDAWGNDDLVLVHYHRDFEVTRDALVTQDEVAALSRGETLNEHDHRHPDLLTTYWIFPVSSYIHSGVVLSLNSSFIMDGQGWDTSHVGMALVAKKTWPDEAKAREAAQSLIEEWNQYLSGDVYGIVKETYDAKKTPTTHDIICGFYGEKYALEALKTDI